MTQRKIQYWVIPPQADAEFVAHMEQVLDLYQKPYDPDCPVVCMDVGIPVKWNSVSGDLEHGFRRSGTLVGA